MIRHHLDRLLEIHVRKISLYKKNFVYTHWFLEQCFNFINFYIFQNQKLLKSKLNIFNWFWTFGKEY